MACTLVKFERMRYVLMGHVKGLFINNLYTEDSLKDNIQIVVFKFTSTILTCDEHVCSM